MKISSQLAHLSYTLMARQTKTLPDFGITLSQERGLLLAVLERAFLDALGQVCGASGVNKAQLQLIRDHARQWLGLEGGPYWMGEEPFSFIFVCDHLNLCPIKVIKRFLQLQKTFLH